MANGQGDRQQAGFLSRVNKWQTLTFGRPPSINTAEAANCVRVFLAADLS